jgi:hypothetical protein
MKGCLKRGTPLFYLKILKHMTLTFTRAILFSLGCIISTAAFCQKHDYYWMNGPSLSQDNNVVIYEIKFNDQKELAIDSLKYKNHIYMRHGQVAMSDKSGKLQFYTNGNYIANAAHEIMENGSGLNNESPFRDIFGSYSDYCYNCYLVLPNLHEEYIFYLIHPLLNTSNEYRVSVPSSNKLLITKVDMKYNNGLGKVIYKDSVIFDQRTSARFSAVKHANGKDWWIITRSENGANYDLLLLGNDEVILQKTIENIDPSPYLLRYDDSVMTVNLPFVVSPSGDLILDRHGTTHKRLLSFDRCTGDMNYINEFEIPLDTYITPGGHPSSKKIVKAMGIFIISENGEFAYAWGANGFYQWDLTEEDIAGSRKKLFGPPIVLDRNQNENPFSVVFPYPVYGPDGKIYYLWRRNHYIINSPNELGMDADVTGPRAFGRNLYFDSPNHPNYRLGPLRGSACDTLISGRQDRYSTSTFKVFPNPTSGPLTIELDLPGWDGDDVTIAVYDALGRRVYRHLFARWSYLHQINPGDLPPGVYFIRLELGGVAVQTQRIVVQ